MLIFTCVYDMKSKEKVTCKLFGVISSSVLNGKFSPPYSRTPLQQNVECVCMYSVQTDVHCVCTRTTSIMCVRVRSIHFFPSAREINIFRKEN